MSTYILPGFSRGFYGLQPIPIKQMNHYEHLTKDPTFWPDNAIYFLTDSTFLHFPYFNDSDKKELVLGQIKKLNKHLQIPITDYSIAINHYHVKFYLKDGKLLSKVNQLLRGGISFEYNRRYKKPYQEMWQTRKTIVVLSEDMNWKISGYIIGNLLKHKELSTFDELAKDKFSSFWYLAKKYGQETVIELIRNVIDIKENNFGLIDFDNLGRLSLKSGKPAKAG